MGGLAFALAASSLESKKSSQAPCQPSSTRRSARGWRKSKGPKSSLTLLRVSSKLPGRLVRQRPRQWASRATSCPGLKRLNGRTRQRRPRLQRGTLCPFPSSGRLVVARLKKPRAAARRVQRALRPPRALPMRRPSGSSKRRQPAEARLVEPCAAARRAQRALRPRHALPMRRRLVRSRPPGWSIYPRHGPRLRRHTGSQQTAQLLMQDVGCRRWRPWPTCLPSCS